MLHLLLGRDWTANQDEILSRLARDVRNRQGNRIFMVPELISHDAERRLCAAAGDTASRYAEVLSFTRLARRVADTVGSAAQECLDSGGRVVAMAAAARQLSSRLKAYASVETKPEFLTGLIDGVDEFKRCCITSQDLSRAAKETEGSLAQKLEELSLLMEGYDGLCARGKRDPRDEMTWLLEQLESCDFAKNHIFYIDGFPDFTRQNMAILEHLILESEEVTVSLNCDRPDSQLLAFEKAGQTAKEILRFARSKGVKVQIETIPEKAPSLIRDRLFQGPLGTRCPELRTYRAESAYQECLHAANRVMELVRSGCRYRDISLVCTDMTVYQPLADLIFHRFRVPLYRSGTEEILQKSVISTVLTALDAAITDFDRRSTLRYLRSALSPLDPETTDEVENYAVIWGIRGKKWREEWKEHPDGLSGKASRESAEKLEFLNRARETAIAPLAKLQKGFRDASSLRGQVLALYGFLEDIRLGRRLEELAREMDEDGDNRSAQILNQLWEILLSALEQLYDVLGDTHWEPEHFTRLFRLLLSQYDVGTIPPVLDAVQMGPVSAMRCNRQKHLIVLGAEEGKLPGYTGSAGLLTDQERDALRDLGVPLTGGSVEGIQAEFAEIYGVFCGAEESVEVFCSGDQPSFVFRRLSRMSAGEETVTSGLGFAAADDQEAGAYLARWDGETLARELGVDEAYRQVCARRDYSLGRLEREQVRSLYGSTLNLSASQVDRQAECRLSYFLEYGLRAKERKEAAVDSAEFGTYVHDVLENTVRTLRDRGGFRQVSLEETLKIAHGFSKAYEKEHFGQIRSERLTYLFDRNLQELDMVVAELWQELNQALFEPAAVELGFGIENKDHPDEKTLPPIPIPNPHMNALLRGKVDRVDVWSNGYCSYYRVVDYKTGRKSFDYCDIFNGVGLQMLLYLFVLKTSGEDLLMGAPVSAGVQYFPARAPYISADGRLDPEEAELERLSQWKRKGLLLKDEAVLKAMEPGDSPSRMDYKVNAKDGSLSGNLADRDQLKQLESYVFKVLSGLVEQIASGDVTPNPYTRGSAHDACAYCPYGGICHKARVEGRRNYKTMTAREFWDEMEKEARHG